MGIKISEVSVTLECSHPDCDEQLILDIADLFDTLYFEDRLTKEIAGEGWKLYSVEKIPYCSHQHMFSAREEL